MIALYLKEAITLSKPNVVKSRNLASLETKLNLYNTFSRFITMFTNCNSADLNLKVRDFASWRAFDEGNRQFATCENTGKNSENTRAETTDPSCGS